MIVNLLVLTVGHGDQSIFFQTDICGLLVKVFNEHDELLVQERGVFRLRKDRFGHSCGHLTLSLGLILSLFILLLHSVLTNVIVDGDQILKF